MSVYLDGTGDSLTWTNNDGSFDVGISSSPFTIEWWQYMTSMPSATYTYIGPSVGGGYGGWNSNNGHQYTNFLYSSNTQWRNQFWNGSAMTDITVTLNGAIKAGQWQHLVAVYDGTNYSHFIDGVRLNTTTTTFGKVANATIAGIGVGPSSSSPGYFPGYISDLRIVKGSAAYSPTSTSLTVPTAPLASVTNTTVHLKGTDAHVLDKAQTSNLKLYGGLVATINPAKFSSTASFDFDGSNNYIESATSPIYNIGTQPFTLECFFRPINTNNQGSLVYLMNDTTNVFGTFIYNTNNSLGVYDNSWITGNAGSGSNHNILSGGTWYYMSIARDSSTLRVFIDGSQIFSEANTNNYTTNKIVVGGGHQFTTSTYLNGHIQDVRLTIGLARYTGSSHTVPSEPLKG